MAKRRRKIVLDADVETNSEPIETIQDADDTTVPAEETVVAADETLPAEEAFQVAAEQLNENGDGAEPHQAALFVTAKEFNDAGAFDAIAEKQQAVQWAKDRYESAKATASELKKVFDREDAELLSLIGELARRKHERERQLAEAADQKAAQDAAQDAPDAAESDEQPIEESDTNETNGPLSGTDAVL